MNNFTGIGRLCADPELRYIPNSGQAVCNFSLAIDKNLSKEKKQEMEAKNQPTADFINIVVWGTVAENCANYLAKGRLVGVQGRLQSGSYEAKDGTKRYTTDVVASNVEFLEWGDKNGNQGQNNQSDDLQDFHPINNSNIPF